MAIRIVEGLVHGPVQAAAEFERVLAERYLAPGAVAVPLAQLGLARARAAAGDVTAARQEYDKFFGLWKDADADVPILLEAQRECAALSGQGQGRGK